MPGLDPSDITQTELLSCSARVASTNIEDSKLYMPSDLIALARRRYCPGGLPEMEQRLWHAQASDSLEDLWHHLRTRSFTNRFKIANITGQIHNTCTRESQHTIDDKVRVVELQYRRARDALFSLQGPGDWEDTLRVLAQGDVRALNERELTAHEKDVNRRCRAALGVVLESEEVEMERVITTVAAVGEGQCGPSWIWFTGNSAEKPDDPLTCQGE